MATASSVVPLWTANTSSLAEYASVLHQILQLCNLSHSSPYLAQDTNRIITSVNRLVLLYNELFAMRNWMLAGNPALQNRIDTILNKLKPLIQASRKGLSAANIHTTLTSILKNSTLQKNLKLALDLENLVSKEQLDISPEEMMFLEIFRKFNNTTDLQLSSLGETMNAYSELLEGLNMLNQACTWNPGTRYIASNGNLYNPSPVDRWYPLFINQVSPTMNEGIAVMRNLFASGIFPVESGEQSTLMQLLTQIDAKEASGGFNGLLSEPTVQKMWEDRSFQKNLRTGIELCMHLNEESQHKINAQLFSSKTISEMTSHLFQNQSESLVNIARKMNR